MDKVGVQRKTMDVAHPHSTVVAVANLSFPCFASDSLSFKEISKKAAREMLAEDAGSRFYKIEDEQNDAVLVRIIWVDASGQSRCRVVPQRRFHDVVMANGVGLTHACMAMCSFSDCIAPESMLTGVGEIRLVPDSSTITRIPWSAQEEMVLGDMQIRPGEAWEYCPREALRRVSTILKEEFNLEMNAGFENEFYLLKPVIRTEGEHLMVISTYSNIDQLICRDEKEEWVPFDSSPYCSLSSYDTAAPILRQVMAALQSLNIPVEQLHAEAGKGQFEISLGHTLCNRAADNLVYTRETIRAIARKNGLLATFMAKYAVDDIGSGAHVHLSLWRGGENVFMGSTGDCEHGMSKIGQEFMAGVLLHLPAILAFIAPNPNSYERLQPNTWSGAYHCWGTENREAAIRTACPPGIPDGRVSNFEIKSFDGFANPYLGLAAIVAAGIDGLRRHLSLPEPVGVNPAELDAKPGRLPCSLSESLESLKKDTMFEDFFSEKLLVAVKAIRKAEIEHFSENKEAHKQLVYRY